MLHGPSSSFVVRDGKRKIEGTKIERKRNLLVIDVPLCEAFPPPFSDPFGDLDRFLKAGKRSNCLHEPKCVYPNSPCAIAFRKEREEKEEEKEKEDETFAAMRWKQMVENMYLD